MYAETVSVKCCQFCGVAVIGPDPRAQCDDCLDARGRGMVTAAEVAFRLKLPTRVIEEAIESGELFRIAERMRNDPMLQAIKAESARLDEQFRRSKEEWRRMDEKLRGLGIPTPALREPDYSDDDFDGAEE